jgi:chemotaxis signal transduction protein
MVSTETFAVESLRDPDRQTPPVAALASTDYFVFRLRGRTYAMPPSSIELVVPMQPIVAVPTVGPHVLGVIYMRGRVIAVIDLPALLGLDDPQNADSSSRIAVVDASCPFAFVCDATLGIWAFADNAQTRSSDDGPIVSGRIEDRGGAATLIDTSAVIARVMSLRTEQS